MKKKHIMIMLFVIFLLSVMFLHPIIRDKNISNKFDKEQFLSKGYSNDEILLFCDIGFLHNRIRKWETDIKVEIMNIDSLNKNEIDDVDSIIKILTPLIYPVKIERVENNGNLKVYRKVEKVPKNLGEERPRGIARMGPLGGFMFVSPIKWAKIYETKYTTGTEIIIHEFLHAIGIAHASKPHKFNLVMSTYEAPSIFNSIDEYEEYMENNYYISEQEKQVIKMLYSSGVKSGLKREVFIKEMGIDY